MNPIHVKCTVCAKTVVVADGRIAAHGFGSRRPCSGTGRLVTTVAGPEPKEIESESDRGIEELPERIEKLRMAWLLDHDAGYLDPEAEQLYLLALGALEQAERFAKLAVYKMRQARSGAR